MNIKAGRRRDGMPDRHMDAGLLIIPIILVCFGLVMLFSASMTRALQDNEMAAWYYVGRQLIFSLIGFFLIWLLNRGDIRRFASQNTLIAMCVFVTILLILVLIPGVGVSINNQRRWLPLPFQMTFQPSEIVKLVVVFGGGIYYPLITRLGKNNHTKEWGPLRKLLLDFWYEMGIPLLIVGFWCFLILQQSHFSAALIIFIELFIVFLAAGISRPSSRLFWSAILVLFLFALLVFAIAGEAIVEAMRGSRRMSHIINRLASFSGDSNTTSYQPMQALLAIGSGGLTGVGLGMGVQKYNYLPEAHNDYVFAIVCEEIGFIGAMLVLLLFLLYFFRGLKVAYQAYSDFGRIAGAGFASLITVQALLSMAVNLEVIPATGVSLPFFSYGGTSNIFFMAGIAILLNISKFDKPPTGIRSPKALQRKERGDRG